MSTQQFTVDPAVAAWAAQVRALRAEHATAITDEDDPRYAKLAADYSDQVLRRNLEEVGEFYFDRFVPLPAFPLAGPTWAVDSEVEVSTNDWPIVDIWHYSEWFEQDRISVRLELFEKIAVDEVPEDYNIAPDGYALDSYVPSPGEIHGRELRVAVHSTNALGREDVYDLDLESAGALADVLKKIVEVSR